MSNVDDDDLNNSRVGALEGFAEASVDSIKTLSARIEVQASHIRALTALTEMLVERLIARGALKRGDLGSELEKMKKATTPVKR